MKKVILIITFLCFEMLSLAEFNQSTRLQIVPEYTRIASKNDHYLYVNLFSDLSSLKGYYGQFFVKKGGYDYTKFNVYESPDTQIKALFGWQFNIKNKYKPYFDISYIPTRYYKFDENSDKNYREYRQDPTLSDRSIPINVGVKLDYLNHKFDVKLTYLNKLFLIVALSTSLDYEYTSKNFTSTNYFVARHWYGERVFLGYSEDYKTPFFYNFTDPFKTAFETLVYTNNNFKTPVSGLEFNLGGSFHYNMVYHHKKGEAKKVNNMLEASILGGLKYTISDGFEFEAKLKDEILVFFTNNKLDEYSNENFESKKFYDFPDDYPIGAKPTFNKLNIDISLKKDFPISKKLGTLTPYTKISYKNMTVDDYSNQYKQIIDNELMVYLGSKLHYQAIEHLFLNNDLIAGVGISGRNRADFKFYIQNKFELGVVW